jgi:parallel beta-helix repeat protein
LAVLIISLVLLFPLAGEGAEMVLRVPGDYRTIQGAIDASSWGDIVLVSPGEYVETVTLKRGVILQSAEGPEVTIIRGVVVNGTVVWGASDSTISGFTITGSFTGINNRRSGTPTVTNNIITGNTVGINNRSASTTITNNTIVGNRAFGIYNAYASPTIINNTIVDNGKYGIYNDYGAPTITNNTIVGNGVFGIYNNYASPVIMNNNIWGYRYTIYSNNSNPTLDYNISADPMFAGPDVGDYHLMDSSPCINTGTNDAPGLLDTDFDGNSRIVGDYVDMGAFESISIQRVCIKAPEFEITSFGPDYIWPPNRKMKDVTVSGRVILPNGCTLIGAVYLMDDEYGSYYSNGLLNVNKDGYFTLTLQVEP